MSTQSTGTSNNTWDLTSFRRYSHRRIYVVEYSCKKCFATDQLVFQFLRPGEITTQRLGVIGHGVELAFSRGLGHRARVKIFIRSLAKILRELGLYIVVMFKLHQAPERWLSIRLNTIWPPHDSYLVVLTDFVPYIPYLPIHCQVLFWYQEKSTLVVSKLLSISANCDLQVRS